MRWWGSVISVDGWTVASVRGELGHPKVSSALASEPEHANQISPQDLAILAIWRNTKLAPGQRSSSIRQVPRRAPLDLFPPVAATALSTFSTARHHLASPLTPPLARPPTACQPCRARQYATRATSILFALTSRGTSSPSDPDLISGTRRGPYARAVRALVPLSARPCCSFA